MKSHCCHSHAHLAHLESKANSFFKKGLVENSSGNVAEDTQGEQKHPQGGQDCSILFVSTLQVLQVDLRGVNKIILDGLF